MDNGQLTMDNSQLSTGHFLEEAVPPGYKRTEVGVIPEDWEVRQLESLVKYTNGKAHENFVKDYGRYILVNSKFISSEGSIKKYSAECFSSAAIGDVLMVMSDVPNGKAIAKCYYVDMNDCYSVNQRICLLSPNNIDSKFLFYKLNRNSYFLRFDDGVKQTNLSPTLTPFS